jgi:hypothetical protein
MKDKRCRWSPEDDELILECLSQGMSYSVIAILLGVTRSMIGGRVYRIKRKGKK